MLMSGVAVFSAGALTSAWAGVFAGAVVGFAMLGLAKPLVDISSQVYVSERVGYGDRARFLGILELSWAGGLLIGAPAAAWLIENWSWEAPFWALGSLGALSIGVAMLYLDRHDRVTNRVAMAPDSPGRQLWLLLTTVTLLGFAHEGILVTIGGWLEGSFGMTLLALGGVGTLLGVSELVGEGAMVAFTDRLGKRNALALGLGVASAALFALTAVSGVLVPALATLMVTTVALEFGIISTIPLVTELRPRSRTRILALSVIASGVGRIASDLVSPRVFVVGGMARVTAMSGIILLCAVGVVTLGVREVSPRERLRSSGPG
jgi:predicted MFS family arabinose efflux permease